MAPDDDDESSWKPPPKQLRIDGRVTGDIPAAAPPPPAPAAPPPPGPSGLPSLDALTTGELVLDKGKPGRPQYLEPGPYRPVDVVPASRRRAVKWIIGLVLAGAAALAVFALVPGIQRQLPLPTPTKGMLIIYSEPSGAAVRIAGKPVGNTPWAADNLWSGEVKYEISANGYKSKWGTFRGGEDVKLDVTLSKK
jgi:hypothetical protein